MIFQDEKNSPVFRKVPTANMIQAHIIAWQADSGIFPIGRHAQTPVFQALDETQ
jgi:hypothetical protein